MILLDVLGGKLTAKTLCPSAQQYLSQHYNLHSMFGYFESQASNMWVSFFFYLLVESNESAGIVQWRQFVTSEHLFCLVRHLLVLVNSLHIGLAIMELHLVIFILRFQVSFTGQNKNNKNWFLTIDFVLSEIECIIVNLYSR